MKDRIKENEREMMKEGGKKGKTRYRVKVVKNMEEIRL